MAMMGSNGGPQWANPDGTPSAATDNASQHEAELFAPLSTLDEPVRETIMRDVRSVVSKLKVVLLPMDRTVSGGTEGWVSTTVILDGPDFSGKKFLTPKF